MLQSAETRLLSVIAWYYLAFFAISVAILGLTIGASWVYLRRSRFEDPARLSAESVRAYLEPVASTLEAAREIERFITSLSAADLLAAEPALRELHAPTLIVWGTGDTFFALEWAYRLRDTIPGATEVVEVPGAKLFFPDERPADLVEPLRRHWAAHPARDTARPG